MNIRTLLVTPLSLACLSVVVAGCSSSAAPKKVIVAPRQQATPVPSDLVSYALSVDPTLKTTIQEGDSLLGQMKQHDMEAVANACTLVGGDFANFQTAFHLGYTPSGANSVASDGTAGYKLILAATDECGMGADASSSAQVKAAASDLKQGLGLLSHAESTLSPWYQTKS